MGEPFMPETIRSPLRAQIDKGRLRTVLGQFATGVVVITAATPRDEPVGMTVNSFSSVSLDPPLVLFCAARRSRLHQVFTTAEVFAVNVLRQSQKDVSRRFASPGFDRFGSSLPKPGKSGVPTIDEALAVIECEVENVIQAGDHDIVIGQVQEIDAAPGIGADPLVYYSGAYRSLDSDIDCWTALA
jgi:flavin reductase (DIM6/NTAB) family NADH-FMN oxidoreductase RutF